MAFRLGQHVVYGELYNTWHYATSGKIVFRDETPDSRQWIRLDLTGDCDPDLMGKHIRFWPKDDATAERFIPENYPHLHHRQIGPTGTMTAQGWARTLPCGVEEFLRRARLGEPPPTEWKRRLYLEWYSQNGRVVIEMADVVVEQYVVPTGADENSGFWLPLPNEAPHPGPPDAQPKGQPDINIVHQDGTILDSEDVRELYGDPCLDESDSDSIPPALQQALNREAAAIDAKLHGADRGDNPVSDAELLDDCLEQGQGHPIGSLLNNVDKLPRPETLNDEEAETQLKNLLMQLAFLNVTLDVCDHFSPRDCYRFLLDTVLPEHEVFKELIGSQTIQHCCTYEYCPECEAEAEAEMDEQSDPSSLPDHLDDDNIPF